MTGLAMRLLPSSADLKFMNALKRLMAIFACPSSLSMKASSEGLLMKPISVSTDGMAVL